MINLTKDDELIKWVDHLQDDDASGAWNKKDDETFQQILNDYDKARTYDEIAKIIPEMYKDWKSILPQINQSQKLRGLIEKAIKENEPYKNDPDSGGLYYELQELLKESKE